MTVTYTDDTVRNSSVSADTFLPRYAQAKRSKKGPKTWMILAPIGALALIGGGAAMMMGGGAETQPLAEPEPVTPIVQPLESAPVLLESSVAPVAITPVPASTPGPVVRETPAVGAPVVQGRTAPVQRRVDASATTTSVDADPEPTGPRPYSASPSTGVVPTAATPAPVVTPPAPSIQTVPLS